MLSNLFFVSCTDLYEDDDPPQNKNQTILTPDKGDAVLIPNSGDDGTPPPPPPPPPGDGD